MNNDNKYKMDQIHIRLIKIIKWQGSAIVFLVIFATVSFFICPQDIKLPNQKALKTSPVISADRIQYKFSIFQNKHLIRSNQRIVRDSHIEIIGQIYDYGEVYRRFKNFKLIFNGAEVALDPQSGYYRINYTLKEGNNTLDMYYKIGNQEYNHQQSILNFQKQ